MKFRALLLLLLSAGAARASVITNDNNALVLFESSYDTSPYHYFGDWVGSWAALGHPQFTNHWASASRGGAGLQEANENRLERLGLPHWASGQRALGLIMADDNGGYTSNQVRMQLTNTFAAPGLFYNGALYTNEGGWAAAHSVTWIGIGAIPHDSVGGDGGESDRNGAMVRMCSDFSLLGIDLWNPMWNGGWSADQINSTQLLGFYTGSHPFASGSLTMAILIAQALAGADTNVSLATVDWNAATVVSTNHCVISSVSRTGGTLTFTRHDDRLPMGWDVPDGTITNDCRNAFVAMPALANAFWFSLAITNLPVGIYDVSIDGVKVATLRETDLANWNMFNHTVGPYWAQRVEVVGRIRDKNGTDRVTLLDHNAGVGGTSGRDLVNYGSDAQGSWDLGTRGDALTAALASDLTALDGYDKLIHDAAQPTDHSFSIKPAAPRFAPFHR